MARIAITMINFAEMLAAEARRTALIQAVRARPKLTVGQLRRLLEIHAYADELEALTVRELANPLAHRPALYPGPGEAIEDAVLRVFGQQPWARLSSGLFCRHMDLPRWTAQKALIALTERGLLVRTGRTSSTRYQLATDSTARRRRARGR